MYYGAGAPGQKEKQTHAGTICKCHKNQQVLSVHLVESQPGRSLS